jgi:PKD repeat protein
MSDSAQTPVPTTTSAPHAPPKHGWLKAAIIGLLGLCGGAAGTYTTALVDRVVKPTKPVANFATNADGLTLSCQNHASGESGWWDFGDGSPLEPYAPDQHVSHAYAKPGTYTIKLTVRNYLGDENERTVPIEIAPAQKDAPLPQIAGFSLQPVSPASVAPATFRLTADVSNAGTCVWDYGDGRVEVTDGGKIDRLVTFEKPGTFAVSLVAHNGKQGAKQSAPVKIESPRDGTTMAVLKITDSGTKLDRHATTESVAVPVPSDKSATTFTKTVNARPGHTLADAAIADAPASVKNVKVQIAADKHSATVTGEWAGDLKTVNKAAGGSDAIIRVKCTQERTTPHQPPTMIVTGAFAVSGQALRADLPLPPAPLGVAGAKREYQLEIRTTRDGQTQTILQAPALTLPWTTSQQGPGWAVTYNATQVGDTVVVTAVQSSR